MTSSQENVQSVLDLLMPVAKTAGPSLRFTTSATVDQIPIYYLISPTVRQQKAVMAVLTLCGRSMEETSSKWQTFVCTWSCIVFPELVSTMKSKLSTNEYRFEPFTADFVEECTQAIQRQGKKETVGDVFLTFPPGLPSANAFPVNVQLASTASLPASYMYYAMLVFIMGKSLTAESITAISTRRPEALMRKAKNRRAEYILQGDGRISTDNYSRIQGGWVKSTNPRKIIVNHLAIAYAAEDTPEILDPIIVNMDMLRHANQTYLIYIYELVVAHPWCVTDLHPLRAAWQYYRKIVHILNAQPRHLVPFYKLMMQDQDKDIRRREIQPLIAVAVFYAAQTREKMNQYRIDPGCAGVVQDFAQMAAAKGYSLKQVSNQATTETSAV